MTCGERVASACANLQVVFGIAACGFPLSECAGVAVSITVVHQLHQDARPRAPTCRQAQAQRRGRSCDSREVMTDNAGAAHSNTDEPRLVLLMTPNTHV